MKRVWQSSALVRPTTTLNRDAVPIGDDIEPMEESRADVETGNEEEEEEESLEPVIPTVETNPKDPISRAEQEREDCGIFKLNRWRRKKENEQSYLPLVSFDYVFSTQENADTFPIPIR